MSKGLIWQLKTWLHVVLWSWRHARGRYAISELETVRSFLKPADTCVDIGAHAGSWTRPLARIVPRGRVFAFEALPYYATVLRKANRVWKLRNVEVLNYAVSDREGATEIAWRTRSGRKLTGNTHMVTQPERDQMECVSVPTITMDGWLSRLKPAPQIAFVKIDVEGAELLVLRGAVGLIKSQRPVIFMEIVTECCARYGYTPARLFEFFAEFNYAVFMVEPGAGVKLRPITAEFYPGKGDVLLVPSERIQRSATGEFSQATEESRQ